ncbi:peroxiredoxin [Aliidiomarina shirensis]|uniref:Glutathione-dependent peroxiredoxin n=1 Tax=Aliidiomarina shirensis TaxID=1048642 RepID=A0A432WSR5_9GAMM|nr:peroxiredoxin [Aliidiomarina shirensis]RUO36806.1 peroxiredoxin [Aliidiomarina shirensis]
MIQENENIPTGSLTKKGVIGTEQFDPAQAFAKGTHVLFAVPGAFTPTCSEQHLPGYVRLADEFANKGVDGIYCLAANDAFVMAAWAKDQNIGDKVTMLSDGDASWAQSIGLSMDTGAFGGVRTQRFAMIIRDGVLVNLFVEGPKAFEVSSAEHVLKHL